jgi:UDP-N-acetylglucosamine transferase subunit ALG13
MVLVLLGTWEASFTRPLIEIEKEIKSGNIKEEVVVQSGATLFTSNFMTLQPFFSGKEIEDLCNRASYTICQAGVGSIMLGLRKGKKVISIPRLKKYNEHIDDHQLEILHVFATKHYILPWTDESLVKVLEKLNSFIPSPYPFQEEKISDAILNFLNKN